MLLVVVVLLLFCCRLFSPVVVLLLLLLFCLLSCFRSFVLVIVLVGLQQIKRKNYKNPCFIVFFWPSVPGKVSPRERPTTQNDKNNKRSVFFFPVLLLFFAVFPYLCVSRFSCYSSFISLICFFLLFVIFFIHLVLLFLPPFPSNCKAAEEGKKRQ